MKKLLLALCGACIVAVVPGCSHVSDALSGAVGSTVNTAGNVAGQRVGTAIGEGISARILAGYQPGLMNMYTSYLFSVAFSSGGFWVEQGQYKPGDYTRWTMPGDDDVANWIERAYLGKDGKGQEWWKVKFHNGKENETTVLQALFSKDKAQMLRLRGKFPKEEAKEIPVTEQTYYIPPTRLTAESIEGATVGTETVKVPAGTFKAKHVVYSYGNGSQEWWLADRVPGGLVQQTLKAPPGEEKKAKDEYTIKLEKYGSDAKDELGAIKPAS
jgi:hypothetical protein